MSIRAYKIEKYASEPTFNITHNCDLISDIINDGNYCDRYISLSREDVEDKLKEVGSEDEEKITLLKDILKDMGEEDSVEYITY